MKPIDNVIEEFARLIPKEIDILHEIKSDRVFCSRASVVNFIRQALTTQREEFARMLEEMDVPDSTLPEEPTQGHRDMDEAWMACNIAWRYQRDNTLKQLEI